MRGGANPARSPIAPSPVELWFRKRPGHYPSHGMHEPWYRRDRSVYAQSDRLRK
ncbi:hypothetical protein LMG29542_05854 [Paraburkholderia humisilvae]|uniref:Uncharacterized protein n=1 Tax=Paraburkholderia humisilvae TaxID=627669 RepID=A0A6J5EQF8_9BURK|nr:hypothetical protein LMG29542_05854 [Paraburkholderia humisilvae]